MHYTRLGRTGLHVSRLCLGTMNFGVETPEADSFAIMDKALDLGINFFDTADIYGWKIGEGITENIVGKWIAQTGFGPGGGAALGSGSRRDKIVLATKYFNKMDEGPNGRGLSAYRIKRCCEGSLKRLRTDHIDLYQMHHVDHSTPFDEIWQGMEQLVKEGKIIYAGSSNFAGWDIATASLTAQHRNFLGLVSEQSIYHLDNRMVELEVIPACRHFGLGLIPWSPLGGGLLGGVLGKLEKGRRTSDHLRQQVEKKHDKLRKWEDFCKEMGEQPADVALAWLLHNPVVTAPIIGPRTLDQLNATTRALEIKLDEKALASLDAIFPGPGGEAPKAYAW